MFDSHPVHSPHYYTRHGPAPTPQSWHTRVEGLETQFANLTNTVMPMWWNQVGGWQGTTARRLEELEKEIEGVKGVLEGAHQANRNDLESLAVALKESVRELGNQTRTEVIGISQEVIRLREEAGGAVQALIWSD